MSSSQEARFEQYVVDRGLVSEDEMHQVRLALAKAQEEGKTLGLPEALVRAGCLTRAQARRVIAGLKGETLSARVTIPGVELGPRIGRGSQAVVYKGRQISVDRPVAVKILLSKAARDPAGKERFLQEARAAAKLAHSNIVQAIDAGDSEGYVYFIMELVDPPRTVADAVRDAGGAMPEADALRIATAVAEALAHAHSRGFIHRDVKPKNIMLTPEGVPKLADMGLARHAGETGEEEAGKAFGTPFYIAPEQALGSAKVDFRADIYSLGATFYEMLTGRPPFTGATAQQIMQKHVQSSLVPPDHVNPALSAGVSEVVEVMMAKRPRDRYRTTEDLLLDLRSVAAGEPPRIARERVGKSAALLEGLAQGDHVDPSASRSAIVPPAAPKPFAVNQLVVLLLIALAISVLINIVMAVL